MASSKTNKLSEKVYSWGMLLTYLLVISEMFLKSSPVLTEI